MEYNKICEICNKQFITKRKNTILCSDLCKRKKSSNNSTIWIKKNYNKFKNNAKKYRDKNKDYYLRKAKEWNKNNPENASINSRKGCDKFRKNNPKSFNQLMINNYHRNKIKYFSRRITKDIIIKGYSINKACFNCGSMANTEIHHEIYHTKKKDIIKDIQNKKIYYLCRICHNKLHNNKLNN